VIQTQATLPPLPLVGRGRELSALFGLLDAAGEGEGGTAFVSGTAGVGKSRLLRAVADEATRRGWLVAAGRSFPVETGVPYALVADAFVPLIHGLEPETLSVLARGGEGELAQLFPALGASRAATGAADAAEVKTRLLWNFLQFARRLAERRPTLVVLEDLHWADASSLELFHFLARHVPDTSITLLGSYIDTERDSHPTLRTMERSLVGGGQARSIAVEPLTRDETAELVHQTFAVSPAVSGDFVTLLYSFTRGNPFFIQETLKSLVESGRLRPAGGTWIGWETEELSLPPTVREAVAARLDGLSDDARRAAEVAAVIGTRVRYDLLRALLDMEPTRVLSALEELGRRQVLEESDQCESLCYDFGHPLIRETLYAGLSRARRLVHHTAVGELLERLSGGADELAYHYSRGETDRVAPKAIHYLVEAGRNALAREANREAADYLARALELSDAGPREEGAPDRLVEDLARARSRVGERDAARALWQRALDEARAAGDRAREGAVLRRLGLAAYAAGRHNDALESFDLALQAAEQAGDAELKVRLLLSKGVILQELGEGQEASRVIRAALAAAEATGSDSLLARSHRALLFLHTWTGPTALARQHGERAIELSERCQDPLIAFACHWGMAALSGLTGRFEETTHHLAECDRIAEELRSPRLRVAAAEVAIEYAHGTGRWDEGLALGERAIALARSLGLRNLLPRVLVWTALIYLRRGDLDQGGAYVQEAWELSGAEDAPATQRIDVHAVVPAHIGRAVEHLVRGDAREAIRVAERGLAIADRSGYVVWAIHRLLPTIAEGYVYAQDREGARNTARRLRAESERMEHRLGLAWSAACDAFVDWLDGNLERAIVLLQEAAEELEAVPYLPDAARLRRQLAMRLADAGQIEAGIRELRRVHEIFTRLGAQPELGRTRDNLRELGSRPPTRGAAAGAEGLTAREVEILRLVAAQKSNKAIGKALGISPRTVSTHLSNVFRKLDLTSRAELGELARRLEFPEA
jgi:DNA-binding CsgD family transcriptional regulator